MRTPPVAIKGVIGSPRATTPVRTRTSGRPLSRLLVAATPRSGMTRFQSRKAIAEQKTPRKATPPQAASEGKAKGWSQVSTAAAGKKVTAPTTIICWVRNRLG